MPGDFAYIEFFDYLPELADAVRDKELRLRGKGHRLLADRLLAAFGTFDRELRVMAQDVSRKATEIVREEERSTRVRPDTGRRELESAIFCKPLDGLPGAVGIADKSVLDAAVPWWTTNEVGSSARVGGVLFGTFTGGASDSRPDPAQRRQHALFDPGRGPNAGMGIIKEPIPARRFVLKSIPPIVALWEREFAQILGKLQKVVQEVNALEALPPR